MLAIDVESLSVDEARDLADQLRDHIWRKEQMTPAELHEHLAEMPQQLCDEFVAVRERFYNDLDNLLRRYVFRHLDEAEDDTYELLGDGDGDIDEGLMMDEFADDCRRLKRELIDGI
jgi:hypothetical protein